jgi:hypothetical protein
MGLEPVVGVPRPRAATPAATTAEEAGSAADEGSAVTLDSRDAPSSAPDLKRLLLYAKFSVLQPRLGVVSHGDLIETARSSDCRLVAVTAPAGYGKSTFLAEWAATEDRSVAWVSLDRLDDDPATLLASLASAYCRAGLGSADLVVDMRGQGVSVLGRAAPRLAAEFRASPVPFVLMLDNLHELRSPACHDVLGMVISAISRGSQLAAASRFEQPHLPRLRASGDALEFRAADLALDAAGARQIFSDAQVSVTPELAVAVTERTEGWPVGIYLTALIAKKGRGQTRTVTGDDRYVADYLYREALSRSSCSGSFAAPNPTSSRRCTSEPPTGMSPTAPRCWPSSTCCTRPAGTAPSGWCSSCPFRPTWPGSCRRCSPAHCRSPRPSYGCFPTCKPT